MAKEKEWLPPFRAGETLIIQRTVNGRNVLLVVEARDPCALGEKGMTLRAHVKTWGTSGYADERVARQREAIDRLLNHLQQHCTDSDCPHRAGGGEGT
jgi:hypothetical protein